MRRCESRIAVLLSFIASAGYCAETQPLLFDTADHGDPAGKAPIIKPWKKITLDREHGGDWVVTGDVDNDGVVDIVSAQNFNEDDVHYTSAVVAQRLDGSVIWRWGDPKIGRKDLHHDVACQIYDWNEDGGNEVILCTRGYLVHLDGATGAEIRRIPIPTEATDCLVFANLSGKKRATDVLVKTRYTQIWAYNYDGKLLWTVENPGGFRTAHQPRPMDIDKDGRDEIMAGYAMLNSDGSVRWILSSSKVDLRSGHLDCCRILRKGEKPKDWRLAVTYCGAKCVALVDGEGTTIWEIAGHHFESVNIGRIFSDLAGLQILVDIDHRPYGESPIWVLDENGRQLGRIMSDYSRHHTLVDWTGDGYREIVIAHTRGIFDRSGRRIATFAMESAGKIVLPGDMTGDGVPDIALTSPSAVYIFRNEKGRRPEGGIPLGSGPNFTLY